MACRLLDDGNDDAHTGLAPHGAPSKPWSAWWTSTPMGGELEVGVAHDVLAERLHRRAVADGAIAFGRTALTFEPVVPDPNPVATLDWPELQQESEPKLTVRFLTPTTLRRGKHTSPWVDPASLLSSLTARWSAVAPPDTTIPNPTQIERASLRVSRVKGETRVITLANQRVVPGFIGEVTYRGDDTAVFARFTTLLRMAEFLGAGARTEYGFGRVRLAASDPKRRGRAQHTTA
ncbi:CRISPR system precrRNA processing endoribonuclease RAMP protein Cas6 [Microbacterium sp.]|uniref:CRISPR system precrRNA processing endoribonuclease RAMP protein Cas6 n=1 Tax=Microbacterium sp. TaxID=51671 RepID=UPI0039E412B8